MTPQVTFWQYDSDNFFGSAYRTDIRKSLQDAAAITTITIIILECHLYSGGCWLVMIVAMGGDVVPVVRRGWWWRYAWHISTASLCCKPVP